MAAISRETSLARGIPRERFAKMPVCDSILSIVDQLLALVSPLRISFDTLRARYGDFTLFF